MGAERYTRDSEYLFLSTESSLGPPTDIASNSASLPQGTPVLDGRCPDPWSLGIFDSEVDAKTCSPGLHRSTILAIDTVAGTPLPEIPIASSYIHNEDLKLTCPSETDTTGQTMISPYQNERKSFTASSSKIHRKPNGKRESPTSQKRFPCNICGLDFSQRRGVRRHHREKHEVSLCPHCSGFEWHRRHQLEEHLKEYHPDVHLAAALAEATSYRLRATLTENRILGPGRQIWGQRASPPVIEYDQHNFGEHLPQPLKPPLPPALELTHNSLPEFKRPTIMNVTRRHDCAREVALFDAKFLSALHSTQGFIPPPNSVDVSIWP